MKVHATLLFMLMLIIISGCAAPSYHIVNNEVKYINYDYGGGIRKFETSVDADPKTFNPISNWDSFYGKDANSVFTGYQKIKNADPKTFTPLNRMFSKDSKRVFYGSKCETKEADIKTFIPINDFMAKDKFRVYKYVFKDDYSCKKALNIIPSTDTNTFKLLNTIYSKDKNAVFFGNKLVNEANPVTFKAFDEWFSTVFGVDDKHVFYRGERIEQADPSSFLVINSAFAKDKNYVYAHLWSRIKVMKNVSVVPKAYKYVRSCEECSHGKKYCYYYFGETFLCLTVNE